MANLESFKDVRTIASVSALIAVGVSSSYFLNEISKIKEEQAEIKRHLASIIPIVNPDVTKTLNNAMEAIKILDSRLAKAQQDIKIISANSNTAEEKQPTKRVYKRLTQRNGAAPLEEEQPFVSSKPKFMTRIVASKQQESEPEIDDDVAAMMG